MTGDLASLVLLVLAILGSLTNWFLAWKDSHPGEPFDFSKAQSSIIRAVISGVSLFVLSFAGVIDVSVLTAVLAFLAGVGIDATGNRIAGIIKNE